MSEYCRVSYLFWHKRNKTNRGQLGLLIKYDESLGGGELVEPGG